MEKMNFNKVLSDIITNIPVELKSVFDNFKLQEINTLEEWLITLTDLLKSIELNNKSGLNVIKEILYAIEKEVDVTLWSSCMEQVLHVFALIVKKFYSLFKLKDSQLYGRIENILCDFTEIFFHKMGHTIRIQCVFIILKSIEKNIDKKEYLIFKPLLYAINALLHKIPKTIRQAISIRQRKMIENLAIALKSCGDFDLQTCIVEFLFHLSPKQFKQNYHIWFSEFTVEQFNEMFIKDTELLDFFSRRLLNEINKIHLGVFSIRCASAQIGTVGLEVPKLSDEPGMDDFWIDFNKGSKTIYIMYNSSSFGADDGSWSSLTVHNDTVIQIYSKNWQDYNDPNQQGKHLLIFINGPLQLGQKQHSVAERKPVLSLYFKSSEQLDYLEYTILPEMFGSRFKIKLPKADKISQNEQRSVCFIPPKSPNLTVHGSSPASFSSLNISNLRNRIKNAEPIVFEKDKFTNNLKAFKLPDILEELSDELSSIHDERSSKHFSNNILEKHLHKNDSKSKNNQNLESRQAGNYIDKSNICSDTLQTNLNSGKSMFLTSMGKNKSFDSLHTFPVKKLGSVNIINNRQGVVQPPKYKENYNALKSIFTISQFENTKNDSFSMKGGTLRVDKKSTYIIKHPGICLKNMAATQAASQVLENDKAVNSQNVSKSHLIEQRQKWPLRAKLNEPIVLNTKNVRDNPKISAKSTYFIAHPDKCLKNVAKTPQFVENIENNSPTDNVKKSHSHELKEDCLRRIHGSKTKHIINSQKFSVNKSFLDAEFKKVKTQRITSYLNDCNKFASESALQTLSQNSIKPNTQKLPHLFSRGSDSERHPSFKYISDEHKIKLPGYNTKTLCVDVSCYSVFQDVSEEEDIEHLTSSKEKSQNVRAGENKRYQSFTYFSDQDKLKTPGYEAKTVCVDVSTHSIFEDVATDIENSEIPNCETSNRNMENTSENGFSGESPKKGICYFILKGNETESNINKEQQTNKFPNNEQKDHSTSKIQNKFDKSPQPVVEDFVKIQIDSHRSIADVASIENNTNQVSLNQNLTSNSLEVSNLVTPELEGSCKIMNCSKSSKLVKETHIDPILSNGSIYSSDHEINKASITFIHTYKRQNRKETENFVKIQPTIDNENRSVDLDGKNILKINHSVKAVGSITTIIDLTEDEEVVSESLPKITSKTSNTILNSEEIGEKLKLSKKSKLEIDSSAKLLDSHELSQALSEKPATEVVNTEPSTFNAIQTVCQWNSEVDPLMTIVDLTDNEDTNSEDSAKILTKTCDTAPILNNNKIKNNSKSAKKSRLEIDPSAKLLDSHELSQALSKKPATEITTENTEPSTFNAIQSVRQWDSEVDPLRTIVDLTDNEDGISEDSAKILTKTCDTAPIINNNKIKKHSKSAKKSGLEKGLNEKLSDSHVISRALLKEHFTQQETETIVPSTFMAVLDLTQDEEAFSETCEKIQTKPCDTAPILNNNKIKNNSKSAKKSRLEIDSSAKLLDSHELSQALSEKPATEVVNTEPSTFNAIQNVCQWNSEVDPLMTIVDLTDNEDTNSEDSAKILTKTCDTIVNTKNIDEKLKLSKKSKLEIDSRAKLLDRYEFSQALSQEPATEVITENTEPSTFNAIQTVCQLNNEVNPLRTIVDLTDNEDTISENSAKILTKTSDTAPTINNNKIKNNSKSVKKSRLEIDPSPKLLDSHELSQALSKKPATEITTKNTEPSTFNAIQNVCQLNNEVDPLRTIVDLTDNEDTISEDSTKMLTKTCDTAPIINNNKIKNNSKSAKKSGVDLPIAVTDLIVNEKAISETYSKISTKTCDTQLIDKEIEKNLPTLLDGHEARLIEVNNENIDASAFNKIQPLNQTDSGVDSPRAENVENLSETCDKILNNNEVEANVKRSRKYGLKIDILNKKLLDNKGLSKLLKKGAKTINSSTLKSNGALRVIEVQKNVSWTDTTQEKLTGNESKYSKKTNKSHFPILDIRQTDMRRKRKNQKTKQSQTNSYLEFIVNRKSDIDICSPNKEFVQNENENTLISNRSRTDFDKCLKTSTVNKDEYQRPEKTVNNEIRDSIIRENTFEKSTKEINTIKKPRKRKLFNDNVISSQLSNHNEIRTDKVYRKHSDECTNLSLVRNGEIIKKARMEIDPKITFSYRKQTFNERPPSPKYDMDVYDARNIQDMLPIMPLIIPGLKGALKMTYKSYIKTKQMGFKRNKYPRKKNWI